MVVTTETTSSERDLLWTVPKSWAKLPPKNMRLEGYEVVNEVNEKAVFSVAVFPDMSSQMLANVNRWRQQLGLGPVGIGDLNSLLKEKHYGEMTITVVELYGEKAPKKSLIVGFLLLHGQQYFFKLTGDAEVVTTNEALFFQVLESITHSHDH